LAHLSNHGLAQAWRQPTEEEVEEDASPSRAEKELEVKHWDERARIKQDEQFGDSYLTRFASGTSRRAPLAVLFFERAGPIGTGVFFFLFSFFSSSVFSFSTVYKKFETVSNSEQISNGTKFEILNIFQMKQFFKF
jgi:hypothetical protein